MSALPTSWKRRGQLFWLGVCEFRMILVGSLGRAGFTRNVIDESSLANAYRQRSSHRSLDDIDGSNGFGIHQIEIFILMAGKTCRTCPACSALHARFARCRPARL